MFCLEMMFLDEVHNTDAEGHGKGGIAEKGKECMNTQPVTLENRTQFLYLPGEDRRREHEDEDHGHGEGTEEIKAVPVFQEKEYEDDAPGIERGRFMKTGNGKMPCSDVSCNDVCGVESEPNHGKDKDKPGSGLRTPEEFYDADDSGSKIKSKAEFKEKDSH